MLRRLHHDMVDENAGKLLRKDSKRQRVLRFFRAFKHKQTQRHDEVTVPVTVCPLLLLFGVIVTVLA